MGVFGVDAVLIIKIDRLDAEALQAGIAGGADVFGASIDAAAGGIAGVAHDAELGGDDDLVPVRPERLADEDLVRVRAVNVGGVEERDTERDGAMDGGDGFGLVGLPVELGHAHASEAEF